MRGPLTLGVAAISVAFALACAGSARADHLDNSPNWPGLLPPNPGNSATTVSPGFDICPSGRNRCTARTILEMYERWRADNATCSHRAVFGLTYLRTTEEYFRTIKHQPDFFSDLPWINHEDAIFANLYFRPDDAWERDDPVPEAWRIAFEAAESDDVTAIGDLLLGMNAHINRDLAFTLAAVGLVQPGGGSRKTDHDRVNFFLERVADPLQDELARRYDELFATTDGSPSPFDEAFVLQTVRGMRQNAWQNAERLVNATSDSERAAVAADIEEQAAGFAQVILAQNTVPGYGPTRDAHCEANLRPSFRGRIIDRRIGAMLDRGRMRVRIVADGPARLQLAAVVAGAGSAGAGKARPGNRITRARRVAVARRSKRRFAIRLLPRAKRLLDRPAARLKLRVREPGSGLRFLIESTIGRG